MRRLSCGWWADIGRAAATRATTGCGSCCPPRFRRSHRCARVSRADTDADAGGWTKARARAAGLDAGPVSRQMEAGLEGSHRRSHAEATEELPVRVRTRDGPQGRSGPSGHADSCRRGAVQVPHPARFRQCQLSTVGHPRWTVREHDHHARNGERWNTVQGASLHAGLARRWRLSEAMAVHRAAGYVRPRRSGARRRGQTANAPQQHGGARLWRRWAYSSRLSIALLCDAPSILFRLPLIAFTVAALSPGMRMLALASRLIPFGH